jgi:pseudaminic acid synthase
MTIKSPDGARTFWEAVQATGPKARPFIIAEMSGNHNQSLETALAIVDAAAESGADAIKLQTYTADSMTLDIDAPEFRVMNPKSAWYGRKLHDLYVEGATPLEWHAAIFERAARCGILCFSSPFSDDAVAFLADLGAPAFKIASFELVDLPLIRAAARTGKPMIMSTGMANLGEIDEAVSAARQEGCQHITLLKCTSTYPATPEDTNLRAMPLLGEIFNCDYGLSDHTLGIGVPVAAAALGAGVIEKHFVLDRTKGGVDSTFSLEPKEFRMMVDEVHRASLALGENTIGPMASELHARARRRSLYIAEDLKSGDVLSERNLRRIRPGLGLAPKHYEEVVGRKINRDVPRGTPMKWEFLS